MKKDICIFMLGCLITAPVASASPYDNYSNLEYLAGDTDSPENRATLVIDFRNGNHYGFGYGWDSAAPTGWDMLLSVESAGGLEIDANWYDFDGDFIPESPQVMEITYDGHTMVNSTNWPAEPGDTFLSYWVSTDGNNWSTTFTGVAGTALNDGDWNAWTVYDGYNEAWPGDAPSAPEPATIALMGIGAAGILVRRRKNA